ncbi:glycosyltransferase family 2 protein [Candidatus Woesebacteria bacterium]|nr:glycosyltransferase family 2 protein [Candidatus Woesebacteria bacterium]
MIGLTGVVLSKNEEDNIQKCLKSLDFCDELVLIDDYSTDQTIKRAIETNSKLKIFKRKLNNNFSNQRNFGLAKARTDWALFIDADERVDDKLSQEILRVIKDQSNPNVGFYIRRQDFIFGKEIKHGEFGTIELLRLFKGDKGRWAREIHEYVKIKGSTAKLQTPLKHLPHQKLKDFVTQINFYSTLHAKANMKEHKKSNVFKIVFYPIFKFINNYFLKLGFLDGAPGLVLSIMMSFHSFLSWSKLWEKQN